MTRLLLLVLLLFVSLWLISPIIHLGEVDPLALVVGVVAIWFVWQENRRNNTPIVRVRECEGSSVQESSRNDGQIFQQFRILLQNCGVSLWNVKVAIRFKHKNYGGTCSYELTPKSPVEANDTVEFARGMLAEYELNSDKFSSSLGLAMRASLTKLENAGKQEAKICVYSQGYLACSIPIGNFQDRIKGQWNRFAYKVNGLFEKTVERPGLCPLLIVPRYVPTFLAFEDKLTYFIWALKQDAEREREVPAD
jgi:hypothetical protein